MILCKMMLKNITVMNHTAVKVVTVMIMLIHKIHRFNHKKQFVVNVINLFHNVNVKKQHKKPCDFNLRINLLLKFHYYNY